MSFSLGLLCAYFVLFICHVSSDTHEGLLWSNPCLSNPCINGECKAHVNSYKCVCYPGFGGDSCELTACYKGIEIGHSDVKIISSPGYNQGSYPVMQICTWQNITVYESSHVWISFNKNFSIERSRWLCPSPTYCCDYVSIYDGPTASDQYFIGQYCGTSPPPPFYSTTGSVSLMFYSDLEQWFERKGFLAYIGGVNDQKYCSPRCIESDFCYQAENASFVCGGICSDDFNPCLNNGTCTSNNFDFICTCFPPFTGQRCDVRINNENLTDCQDLNYYGYDITGVQTIYPNGINSTRVLCEFDGQNVWTIIQNRAPGGSSNFNRSWSEYEIGFVDSDSYWVGLSYQKQLTNNRGYSLRVDLMDCKGNAAFSEYELFKLTGDNYTLTAENFDSTNSTAGDSISPFNGSRVFNINGQPFSAFNKDNSYSKTSCARMYGSGWWWLQCSAFTSNLNGQYYSNCTASVTNGGIQWDTWKPSTYSYYSTKMKIRRNNS